MVLQFLAMIIGWKKTLAIAGGPRSRKFLQEQYMLSVYGDRTGITMPAGLEVVLPQVL